MYAKFDQNIPRGSRVMNISLTGNRRAGGWMYGGDLHSDYSADPRVVQYFIVCNVYTDVDGIK